MSKIIAIVPGPNRYEIDQETVDDAIAIASVPALVAVAKRVIAEYEDTFIHPDEMTGESHEIYAMAKAAISGASAGEPKGAEKPPPASVPGVMSQDDANKFHFGGF